MCGAYLGSPGLVRIHTYLAEGGFCPQVCCSTAVVRRALPLAEDPQGHSCPFLLPALAHCLAGIWRWPESPHVPWVIAALC